MAKITAAQKKQVAALVKAAKRSDGKVTFTALQDAIDAHYGVNLVAEAVYDELRDWSRQCAAAYARITADLDRIACELRAEQPGFDYVYLTDQNVDEENVLVYGRTTDSVDFWSAMTGAAGVAAGDRASSYDVDLNARLGYAVF